MEFSHGRQVGRLEGDHLVGNYWVNISQSSHTGIDWATPFLITTPRCCSAALHYHVSPVSTIHHPHFSGSTNHLCISSDQSGRQSKSQPTEMFYFNSALKLIWQWCWVTSLISYHLSVRVFTLTWWKYFNYKWENHHLTIGILGSSSCHE